MYTRWWVLLLYAVLFAVAVPWYWRWLPIAPDAIWLGVPAWTAVALAGSIAISVTTFTLLLSVRWPEEGEDSATDEPLDEAP